MTRFSLSAVRAMALRAMAYRRLTKDRWSDQDEGGHQKYN